MSIRNHLALAALPLGLAGLAAPALAGAPGEDPVLIQARVSYLQLPTAAPAKSGDINYRRDMPDDMQAKVSRYTAKAYSATPGNVATERDVVQSVRTQGLRTTCYQSVGSTSASGNKLGNNEQVVVLRGDLVNLCN